MRYISLFSGIEAASVAWEPLGWEPVAFSEIEPFPCEVLAQRFPNVPNLGDITQVDWSSYRGSVDLIVGGSPCQSFSIAGNREGLEGASGLMCEYIRAVQEVRPRYFVWENVPGALSSEKGRAFGQLLAEMDDCGYGLAWRVLDAQFFGVPQRRRRVFLVGYLGDPERASEILFERESMRWDYQTSREKRKSLTAGAESSLGLRHEYTAPIGILPICMASGQAHAEIMEECCPTQTSRQYKDPPIVALSNGDDVCGALCARDYKGVGNQYVTEGKPICTEYAARRLTPTECERLQGFPDGWTAIEVKGKPASDTPRYKALGNSMAVPVMEWIGKRIERGA